MENGSVSTLSHEGQKASGSTFPRIKLRFVHNTWVQNNRVWRHEHVHRALAHPLTDESRSRFTNCSGAEDFYIFAWRRSLLIRLWLSRLQPAHRGLWDVTSLWLHLPKGVQPGDSPAFEWGWHVCLFNMNYIWKTRMTEVTSMTAGRENTGRH